MPIQNLTIVFSCLTKPAYHIMESKEYMKDIEIKKNVYKTICLAVKHHGHGFGECGKPCCTMTLT